MTHQDTDKPLPPPGDTKGKLVHRLHVGLAAEVFTKSDRTRRRFLRILMQNLKLAAAAAAARVHIVPQWSHVLVQTDNPRAFMETASRVFGVHSVSRVADVPFSSLDGLVADLVPHFGERVAGRTFAVRVRRSGTHPFGSNDVARALGAALRPFASGVDLEKPEVEVVVRIADQVAHAVGSSTRGPAGLPVGSGGRVLALFSGGFDSPVAVWRSLRRGLWVDLVHFDLGGCGQADEALAVAKELMTRWLPGAETRIHIVDLGPAVGALVRGVQPRLRQVLLKRTMYRAAEILAHRLRSEALVTGESLAQVSTQTLRNLVVADTAVNMSVLRPLVGMEKEETLAQARLIGTHDVSAAVKEHCSIAEGRVETKANESEIRAVETALAGGEVSEAWLRDAVERRRVVPLASWSPAAQKAADHLVERVPAGHVVVDVREPEEGPPVGELQIPLSQGLHAFEDLDPARSYVFVCSKGQRSAMVARALRESGFVAASLAGGVKGLGRR